MTRGAPARSRSARTGARLAAALLLAALAGGCRTVVDAGAPLAPDDPALRGRLAALRERSARRSALRGLAHVALDAPGARLSRPQRVVAERPARLRVEVLGLFDQVAGIVATDGARFAFVDLASGRREEGPVDDDLLWRTARIDLAPSEAVALLLGAPPIDDGAHVVAARSFADGAIAATLAVSDAARAEPARLELEWDGAGELRRAARTDASGERWSARFGDVRDAGGRPFAHDIALEFPRVGASARIEFRSVELDPVLSPGLFVLQVPRGG
ncbi:MAG: hypothetical protein R3E88_07785 [Myxococcota bacterium]